jgi:sortase A
MKALRLFVVLTLLAGVSLSARAAYLHAKAELASLLIHRAWEARVTRGESRPPWPWADTHPVARLQIPRLGYDEIVLEGASARTLAFGPARLLSGADFGQAGNVVLAGHRTSWFKPLEAIGLGDAIELQWLDSRSHQVRQRTYIVNKIDIVVPEDVTLLAPTASDSLTLVTCYPFTPSPHSPERLVIRAKPASTAQPATDSQHHRNPGRFAVMWLDQFPPR